MAVNVYIRTFGCQMNKLDSELVADELGRAGFALCDGADQADVLLFNTCSVRQHAENRVLACLRELSKRKVHKPALVAGLIGCMAQRQGQELLDEFSGLDIVCAPGELHRLSELIANARNGAGQQLAITNRLRTRRHIPPALEELDTSRSAGKCSSSAQAYLRVMRGCDKFCSYCIVPKVRGRELSRPVGHIIDEAKKLIQAGCIEITLLGQTVNSYHYGNHEQEVSFAQLLRRVGTLEGLQRLRFITSYPADFDEDIFQAMAQVPTICNYLHLPAQSGSDKVLATMNRRYTAKQYLDLIDRGRAIVPELSLAGDFIVGFPGETETDFQHTVQLVKAANYKNCFVFKYSPRPGTAAANRLPDDVPVEIKRRRNNELLAVQEQISLKLQQSFIGKTVEILVEGPSKNARKGQDKHSNQLVGRTRGDNIVVFDAVNKPERLIGTLARVKITNATALTLFGEPAEPS